MRDDFVHRPVIYYIRHGLTDWNVEHRLQGRHDIPLNAQGRAQAMRCGEILRDLFDRDGRVSANLAYVSSPLVRARETMELMRSALGLSPAQYGIDARLVEISFGEWEGLTYADVLARDKEVIAERESDKWNFLPPAGESYAQLSRRIGEWYETVHADTVVSAHGGTARALIAHFEIVPRQDAPHYSVDQGVVYVFADNRVMRYA
jgi:broad specificity phosphatase PhoE